MQDMYISIIVYWLFHSKKFQNQLNFNSFIYKYKYSLVLIIKIMKLFE